MAQTLPSQSADLALGQTLAQEADRPGGDERPMPVGIARYVRGRELGRGGMGRVLEAVDQQFNRSVAIKQIIVDQPAPSVVHRFATEAIVTGHLEHPGIPPVYERGVDETGRPFYAMRRVPGRSLSRLLAEAATREQRLALLPIVVRVAQTVGFAHASGVIHRDLKPDNILVGDHGETFVLDWGLARVRGAPTEDSAALPSEGGTVYGAVVGTPAYMAPEQAAGALDRIDERTDVFALGALLHHVLSGAPPYRAATIEELIAVAREGKPPELDRRELPRELVAICTRATAREPDARYRDANALANALEAFQARAVLARPSPVNRVVNITMAGTVALAVFGVVLTFLSSPSLGGAASPVWTCAGLTVFGCGISIADFATRGRHHLGALGIGFALATFFIAVLAMAMTASQLMSQLAGASLSAAQFDHSLAQGLVEPLSGLAIGSVLSAMQIALWAIARRRAAIHRDAAAAIE